VQTAEATNVDTETFVLVEVRGNVGVITLNRPRVFNALCEALTNQLTAAPMRSKATTSSVQSC
jgi:enoyl-CoA hydratase/carnithine racemase